MAEGIQGAVRLLQLLTHSKLSTARAGILSGDAIDHLAAREYRLTATYHRAAGIDVVQEDLYSRNPIGGNVARDAAEGEWLALRQLRSKPLSGLAEGGGYRVDAWGKREGTIVRPFEPVGHFRDGSLRSFVSLQARPQEETFTDRDVYVTLHHGLGVLRLGLNGKIRSLHLGYLGLTRYEQERVMSEAALGVYEGPVLEGFVQSPLPTALSFTVDSLDLSLGDRLGRFFRTPPWDRLHPGQPLSIQVVAPEEEMRGILTRKASRLRSRVVLSTLEKEDLPRERRSQFFTAIESAVHTLIQGGAQLFLEFYALPKGLTGGGTERLRPASPLFQLGGNV